ncbi:MAG: hypothetical protein WA817_08835 [Candidatus Acidiferrum sp.]
MRLAKRRAVLLIVFALVLFALQAGVWKRSMAHDHSETAKQNSESQHPPTEIPGVAGVCLLLAAGALVVMAAPPYSE